MASAQRTHAEWQNLSIGDHLASTPSGASWFTVAALEPQRFLALRASVDLRGRPFDPAGPRPRFYSDSTWCFLLDELFGGRTRLLVSGFATASPRGLSAIANVFFWEPAHWIMQNRQFAGLKQRVERTLANAA